MKEGQILIRAIFNFSDIRRIFYHPDKSYQEDRESDCGKTQKFYVIKNQKS